MKTYADILLINGRFLTMEDDMPTAEAVAIADGKLLYVGTEETARTYAYEDTKTIDLQGRIAAPGLIECHAHPTNYASMLLRVDCTGENTASLKQLLTRLREAAATTPPGEWIFAYGYDESKFAEGPIPMTKDLLDEAVPDHPLMLRRTCGHIYVVNSRAMELSGFTDDSSDPDSDGHFFRDENGHLTGMITGSLQARVPLPPPSEAMFKAGVPLMQDIYFRNGVTTSADMNMKPEFFRIMQQLDRENKLKLRIGFYQAGRKTDDATGHYMFDSAAHVGLQPGFGSDHLWYLGLKYTLDGSTGGHTAAYSEPYLNEPNNYGELYNEQEDVNHSVLVAAKAGVQTSIHAIGDRAIESALTAIEYANAQGYDTRPLRFRLEHLELPTADQLRRIKDLELLIGLSSVFVYSLGDSHVTALGQERLTRAFPAKTLSEMEIPFGCNSDCPICDVNPLNGIYGMVVRTTENGQSFGGKAEAIDRMRALQAYTKDSAKLLWCEDKLGTLKAGKLADLVVFEDDYLTVPDEQLKDIRIYMTVSGGEIVYRGTL